MTSNASILAVSGSGSASSINAQLLRFAIRGRTDAEYLSVRDIDASIFGVDIEKADGIPADITELYRKLQASKAVILASPEHNGSMPARLKNVIDWLSRVDPTQKFFSKPVLLLSTSPGARGGGTNLSALAKLMPWWGATVIDTFKLGNFYDEFDVENGKIRNDEVASQLQALVQNSPTLPNPPDEPGARP